MEKSDHKNANPSGFGPGKTLRKARLDLKLTEDDAATQLHLGSRQIIALENDDYANLPQATYVRGYLRSYAQLLGLAPESILESYSQLRAQHQQSRPTPVKPEKQAASRDGHVKLVSYAVTAVMIGLVLAWWQGREQQNPPKAAEVHDNAVPAASYTAVTAATVAPEARLGEDAAPQLPTAPVSGDEPRQDVPAPEVVERSAQISPAPSEPVPVVTEGPHSRLVLEVEEESWAEVRDARQSRLLYQNVAAGRVVVVEGVPPLSVFLGNVDGVKVTFEDEPIDAVRYKRGATARFTLGQNGASR